MKNAPLIFLALFAIVSCTSKDPQPDNTPNLRLLSQAENVIVQGNNEFACSLFKELQNPEDPNQFFSPLSVGIALGMTLNGAEEETRQGILSAIQFADLSADEVNQGYYDLCGLLTGMDRTVSMSVANSVWYRNTLAVNPDFASTIESSYRGIVKGLDFSEATAPTVINDWIESKTNKKIKNVIEEIDPALVMFLINAIHFKGDWAHRFDASKTRPGNFVLESGSTIQTPMMEGKHAVSYYANEMMQLIGIPFGNGQYEFTVLLPGSAYTTDDVISNLTAEQLEGWFDQTITTAFTLRMPKFTLRWKERLNASLTAMGMGRSFSPDAQFPYLFEEPLGLRINFVDHISFLEVYEAGAEAAAVTTVGIEVTSVGGSPGVLSIDRPFVFLIREKHSGAIAFMGQLRDPSK